MKFSFRANTPVSGSHHSLPYCDRLTKPGQFSTVIVDTGLLTAYIAKQKTQLRSGDILILGPKAQVNVDKNSKSTVSIVRIDANYLVDSLYWSYATELIDHANAKQFCTAVFSAQVHHLRLPKDHISTAHTAVNEICQASIAPETVHNICHLQSLWFRLLAIVFPPVLEKPLKQWKQQSSPQPRRLQTPARKEAEYTKELLEEAIDYDWSLEELAQKVHISTRQLTRIFKETFGLTPANYLTSLRVGAMAKLLRETESSIETVAQTVGWSSRARATNAFNQYFGMPPGTYRSLAKQNLLLA